MLNLIEPTPMDSYDLRSWDNFSNAFRESFRPVTIKEYDTFQPYFAAWEQSGRMPRYYQSMTALMEAGVYWWGVIDDCLVIIKRRCIHNNPIFYLILPPISKTLDHDKETFLIKLYRDNLNVSTKLTEDDLLHGVFPSNGLLRPDPWPEFVYETSVLADLAGKKLKTERHEVNRIKARIEKGELRVVTNIDILGREMASMESIVQKWEQIRDMKGQVKLLKQLFQMVRSDPRRIRLRGLFEGVTCIGYSAAEYVSDRYWNIVAGIRNYDYNGGINDPNMFLQHFDSDRLRHWKEVPVTHINIGSSAPKGGLYEHKMRLRPCAVMTINTLETPRPLTKAEWEMTRRS